MTLKKCEINEFFRYDWDALGSSSDDEKKHNDQGSDFENHHENSEPDSDDNVNSEDLEASGSEDDFNPFGSGSEDEDPWARKRKPTKKSGKKSGKKSKKSKNGGSSKNGAAEKVDRFAHLYPVKPEVKTEFLNNEKKPSGN